MNWLKYRKPSKEEIVMLIGGSIVVLVVWYIIGVIAKTGMP
jgi:hypothetical protein